MSRWTRGSSAAASARVARAAEEKKIRYLRAKVSGSVKPATEGTLTIFVSGPRDAYEQSSQVFGAMGKKVYYVGPGEEAIFLKLVHSVMIGVTAAMVGEAFAFTQRGKTAGSFTIDRSALERREVGDERGLVLSGDRSESLSVD